MIRNRDMPAYPKANPHVAEPGGLTKRQAAAIQYGAQLAHAESSGDAPWLEMRKLPFSQALSQTAIQLTDALFDELERTEKETTP